MIVSGTLLERVDNPSRFEHRFLGQERLRGRAEWLDIYEVLASDEAEITKLKQQPRAQFEDAVRAALAERWADARSRCDTVLAIHLEDAAALRHRDPPPS